MNLNTLDVKLTPRKGIDSYNLEVNDSTLKILALILEFKLATSRHLSRFMSKKDQDKYFYLKLRRMWRSGLMESFKVYSDSRSGVPVFYILSKKGLKLLSEYGLQELHSLKTYPEATTLLDWGLFKHEAQIVELASLESLNKATNLDISFKGEISSRSLDYMSNKHIEVLTPDYTVVYKTAGVEHNIYTEFERTRKSNEAVLNKIQRYFNFLSPEDRQKHVLRLVFQKADMEQAFWLNIFTHRPTLLRLNIVTTYLSLIAGYRDFLQPVYASESTVRLNKAGQLKAEVSNRIKLFNFL